MKIPKYWRDKVHKCVKCGQEPFMFIYKKEWADDIGGRAFCANHKVDYVEVQCFGKSRYKAWKQLVNDWNEIQETIKRGNQ